MHDVLSAAAAKTIEERLETVNAKLDHLAKLVVQLLEKIPNPGAPSVEEQLELVKLERDELRESLQRQVRS